MFETNRVIIVYEYTQKFDLELIFDLLSFVFVNCGHCLVVVYNFIQKLQ